jgi:oligopeptidase A
MTNPLLTADLLPNYQAIKAEHAVDAVKTQIAANQASLCSLLKQPMTSFSTLVEPVEEMQHRLNRIFAPISHLNSVMSTDSMRSAYTSCLDLLTKYHTEIGQNQELADAYRLILEHEGESLSPTQKRLLTNALRDFRLAGVHLPADQKARFVELMQAIARAQASFEEHVLDATRSWSLDVTDPASVAGVPTHALERASIAAREAGFSGWRFTLDQPTYLAVVTHADDRNMRRAFYEAWVSRASDVAPSDKRFDNSTLIVEILRLRHEAAHLLGFSNFAEMALATRMAKSPAEVLGFLRDLASRYLPAARREFIALQDYAGHLLEAWDVAYYSEKLKHKKHNVSEEALRPWFPLPRVLEGLFEIAHRLYGVTVTELKGVALWHQDARYYELRDTDGGLIGGFYADFYARPGKRAGAWMGEVSIRKHLRLGSALPIANLVCNFTPPGEGLPALLTHSEVVTLFHEFGHALHHLLTSVDYPSIAGINGVAWDAVELPSQLMEQWAWQPQCLPLISSHVTTGEPLPDSFLKDLIGTRGFHAGLAAVRQLEFALFDFLIHSGKAPPETMTEVDRILAAVRGEVSVVPTPAVNRFAHNFMHVFSGGYAAGYYSYKWAEVLAADCFAAFLREGVFDTQTSQRFLHTILSRGGACDQMDAFIAFRGRRPEVSHLLSQDGLAA